MVEEFAESSYKDKQARSAENPFVRQLRKRPAMHGKHGGRYLRRDTFPAAAC